MTDRFDALRNGVVLAELGGHGDGPYCAAHAAGAALAVMGTYLVDAGDSVPYPSHFVFKPGRSNYSAYLADHVAAAKAGVDQVAVSVISVELADSIDFLQAAQEAGADYASLCAYSAMDMFTSAGLGMELCRPANRDLLRQWATAVVGAVDIPVIFKIGQGVDADTLAAIDIMAECGAPIVHVAVARGESGLAFVSQAAQRRPLLIAGGRVHDVDSARPLLDAGADAVAVATAAMRDPSLCARIQHQLRALH
jgi:tRNA-dihydrouridine synthase